MFLPPSSSQAWTAHLKFVLIDPLNFHGIFPVWWNIFSVLRWQWDLFEQARTRACFPTIRDIICRSFRWYYFVAHCTCMWHCRMKPAVHDVRWKSYCPQSSGVNIIVSVGCLCFGFYGNTVKCMLHLIHFVCLVFNSGMCAQGCGKVKRERPAYWVDFWTGSQVKRRSIHICTCNLWMCTSACTCNFCFICKFQIANTQLVQPKYVVFSIYNETPPYGHLWLLSVISLLLF